jgi:hypothetical protein
VWNDVRTVLLLVVLMFIATSVTFDELLVMDPDRGIPFFVGGLVFASGLTELLLRGIRLHLPLLFRLPYHLILSLFFLYPIALVPILRSPHDELLMWSLWGFAPLAGLVFLTLLPAIRKGPHYLNDNGSPWPWPFYPWSVFVFLALAVCGRAFLLCWSFHLLPDLNDRLIFGPYFLVPFGFALAVLVLELGLVARSRVTLLVAAAMPLGLIALAAVGHRDEALYNEFLAHFQYRMSGTPLYISLLAAGTFYVYAWARGGLLASEGATVVLATLAFVQPETLTLGQVAAPDPSLLVAAVLLQVAVGLLRSDAWRLAIGVAVASGWCGVMICRGYRELRDVVPGLDYLVVSVVLLPLAVLVSLGKGGTLSRWVERWSQRFPAPR